MDCHNCVYIRYSGSSYGRCTCPGHQDVVFSKEAKEKRKRDGKRVYSRQICNEFKLRQRCSNCMHWVRGKYFADGKTPSAKGYCNLGNYTDYNLCPCWKLKKSGKRANNPPQSDK